MAGETIITVVGNLTRDPELRTIGNGSTVVNFTIASSTRNFDRQSNQWTDGGTLFLNCSAWDSERTHMASNIAQSLAKGMNVIAQGILRQRSYEDDNHVKHTVTELRVQEIGPTLKRATAQVTRQTSSAASGGFHDSRFDEQTPTGGYQGGATATASNSGAVGEDPWGQPIGQGVTFGAPAEFGGDDPGEPAF
ncbi:single-stranded DNA-binding protein [Bifidobacterium cuniculi]|uniref:Single-stranded DNA-binding protein n=1 Tax=Bifidobacterium cuniculi TaxID=1688 RepID=A0A087B4H2_9BIFI|nr:single-stranded DNA-binding protein [Bifidobacterium cuniculi]KFI65922.1 single-stranded DNA-binding protein [Bifidobacterium cuniculi]